ncbi:MAG: EF-hand domain-containing protein [Kiritimatiellae bacterium]|nr:EF-hand domain-containing protein [Kiritimatiellia bacterium]
MRTLLAAVVLLGSLTCVQAEKGENCEKGKKHHKRPSKAEMLEKFDKDGNGELSESEREVAHKAMKAKHREHMKKRFDKDGDGELNADEQAALDARMAEGRDRMKKMRESVDTDGDGTVSEDERAAAREAHKAKRAAVLEEFDADGDGRLNGDERKAAMASGKMPHRPGGHHKGHKRGRGDKTDKGADDAE